MKFLCVPCDSPMKLQTVGPPDRGSLSIVYSCPECGYEMAMLTNAYETQVVQSLGVRIGPEGAATASGSGCPFSAMIPTGGEIGRAGNRESDGAGDRSGDLPTSRTPDLPTITWTAAAEARLQKVPEFVRPMARKGIERFAVENGSLEIDEKVLDAARDFFGM